MVMEVVKIRSIEQQSAAEEKIAKLLRNCGIDGTALWGVPYWEYEPKTKRRERYETDFLIILKRFGLIALEVKGGRVTCEVTSKEMGVRKVAWTSLDGKENVNKIKAPDDQADRTKWNFVKRLRNAGLRGVPATIGIALPNTQSLSASWIPPQIIGLNSDFTDVTTFERYIKRIVDYSNPANQWSEHDYQLAINEFLPKEVLRSSKSTQFEADEDQIESNTGVVIDLVTDQVNVLRELYGRNRALVSGFPGTGKTLIAIRHARSLANSGLLTLFVVPRDDLAERVYSDLLESGPSAKSMNRDTVERIRQAIASSNSETPNLVVVCTPRTLLQLLLALIKDSTERPQGTAKGKQEKLARKASGFSSDKWAMRMEELIPTPIFDAFVFDEGQDLSAKFFNQVLKFSTDSYICPLYVFGDLSQQFLSKRARKGGFKSGETMPWQGHIHDSVPILLGTNCRNGSSINKLVGNLATPYPCHPSAPIGQIQVVTYSPLTEPKMLARIAKKVIKEFHSLGISDEQIMTIFCEAGFNKVPQIRGSFRRGIKAAIGQRRLWNASEVKGLESPAVLVILGPLDADIKNISSEAYLACSRAKSYLVILCPENLKDSISDSL